MCVWAPPTGVVSAPFQLDITEHILTLFVRNKARYNMIENLQQEVDRSCM